MSENQVKDRSDNNADGNSVSGKKKKSTYVIIGLLLVIIIVLLIVIYFLFFKQDKEEEDTRDVIVTEDNLDDMREEMEKEVEGAYYETSMTIDWTFENGKAASEDAFVENSTANTHMVYFDVNLSESGKLVYSSPYIPVGKALDSITLTKNLKKGDYPAVVTYHLVDDDKKEVSNVAVEVTLHILN